MLSSFLKFDVKEDINPKSIPMFNARKNKNKTIILNNKEKNNEFFDYNIENLEKIYNNKNIIRLWKGLELNEVKNTIELGKKNIQNKFLLQINSLEEKKVFLFHIQN